MTSIEIKYEIMKAGLTQFKVAGKLGYSETVFSKKLRNGLSKDEIEKVLAVIERMKGVVENGKN
jgi:hypothetical protein